MNYEKIVTLYDTAEHAEAAKRSLEAAGFAPSEISLINSKTLGVAGDKLNEPGLWHRLFGRDIKEYEATVYGRSVAAGGVVLTIRVPEAEASRAMSILNAHRAVDLSKRAEQEGLMGTPAAAVTSKPATVQTARPLQPRLPRLRLGRPPAKRCSRWPRNKSMLASAWSRGELLEFGASSPKHRWKPR